MPDNERPPGVLVVDDDEPVRTLLGAALPRLGFAVWLAASGQEALTAYAEHGGSIAVVLLDVVMPGLDGPQTLAALRRTDPAVRAVFMTAHAGAYTEEALLGLGASRVVYKPFPSLTGLAQLLREVAAGP
jgi:CheY-like chemotaxis protein